MTKLQNNELNNACDMNFDSPKYWRDSRWSISSWFLSGSWFLFHKAELNDNDETWFDGHDLWTTPWLPLTRRFMKFCWLWFIILLRRIRLWSWAPDSIRPTPAPWVYWPPEAWGTTWWHWTAETSWSFESPTETPWCSLPCGGGVRTLLMFLEAWQSMRRSSYRTLWVLMGNVKTDCDAVVDVADVNQSRKCAINNFWTKNRGGC